MHYVLCVMFFFIAGIIVPISGSENKIIAEVSSGCSRLLCLSKKEIEKIRQIGINVADNELCFSLSLCKEIGWEHKQLHTDVIPDQVTTMIKKIQSLPLSVFVTMTETGQEFKKNEEMLCSVPITHNNKQFVCEIRMQSQGLYFDRDIERLKKDLKQNPNYYPDDEEELLRDGILAKVNGKIVHGPHGYFGSDVDNTGSSFSYLSYLKVPAIGLLVSYVLWILYNKIH